MKLTQRQKNKMQEIKQRSIKLAKLKSSQLGKLDYTIIGGDMNGYQAFDGFSLSDTWNKLWSSATDSLSDAGQKLIDANKQALLDKAQVLINKEIQEDPAKVAEAQEKFAQVGTDTIRKIVANNKWYFIGGGVTLLAGFGAIVYFSRKK